MRDNKFSFARTRLLNTDYRKKSTIYLAKVVPMSHCAFCEYWQHSLNVTIHDTRVFSAFVKLVGLVHTPPSLAWSAPFSQQDCACCAGFAITAIHPLKKRMSIKEENFKPILLMVAKSRNYIYLRVKKDDAIIMLVKILCRNYKFVTLCTYLSTLLAQKYLI